MGLEACAIYGYGFELLEDNVVSMYAKFMSRKDTSDSDEGDRRSQKDGHQSSSEDEDENIDYPEDMLTIVVDYISQDCGVKMSFRKDTLRDQGFYVYFEDLAVEGCQTGATPWKLGKQFRKKSKAHSVPSSASAVDTMVAIVDEKHMEAIEMFNRFAPETVQCAWNMYVYIA